MKLKPLYIFSKYLNWLCFILGALNIFSFCSTLKIQSLIIGLFCSVSGLYLILTHDNYDYFVRRHDNDL